MKTTSVACLTLIAFLPLIGCGGAVENAAETAAESEFDCPSTSTVASVSDLNSPSDCETASSAAVERLDSGHYLRACGEATPGAPQPTAVESVQVTQCTPTEDRGVFVDVEVCCPEIEAIVQEPGKILTAAGPSCPAWRTRAWAGDLHYPDAESCAAIIPEAESDPRISHYRKACKKASPRATRPVDVLEARVVKCHSGGGTTGVVVHVELCCDAKVYDESEFKELVWKRPLEEVRAALGEPSQVTEWPQGTHWSYPLEVARDDRVFPEVTVVIVDNRVESYHFSGL
jgi:hypothetical protein